MKTQALTLMLCALALMSIPSANAQQVSFGTYGVGQSNLLTYPAVLGGSALVGGCANPCAAQLDCAPLFGRHTWYDNRFGFGYRNRGLLGLGGNGWNNGYGLIGGGLNTFSAVVPNQCGAAGAAPVCGQRIANSWLNFRVFGFGLGLGRVSPRWDMRSEGQAL